MNENTQMMIYQAANWIIPLVIAIVFHEVAHGLVARYYGDMTAANAGRLTLNPIRHVDPVGTIILPLILAVAGAPVFGWAKGVPVNDQKMRNPRWNMVVVAAAGPLSNIILALIGAGLIVVLSIATKEGGGGVANFVLLNLYNFIAINLFLALFNMLPIPPFDGSKVLAGILPPALGARFRRLDRLGMLIAIALLVVIPSVFPSANIIGPLISAPVIWVFEQISLVISAVSG
jgi:Zn-dependent protease